MSTPTMSLEGRTAVVTGTGPNIGAGIALELAAAGARVWALDYEALHAESCAEEIRRKGGWARSLRCDVADEADVRSAFEAVEADRSADILVNGAATYVEKGLLSMSPEEWTRQLGVILTGAFLMTRLFVGPMVDRSHGCVINLASTAAYQGQPGNIGYCSAKAGILNFTRSAAMELAGQGVRVNTLTPTATGTVELTERAEAWGVAPPTEAGLARRERSRTGIPMERLPEPHDYGRAAVFLASEEARMITGTDLRVDAGATARYWAWR
jgi:NAD(P)-dependent dehydrogenase (short-subunit alcohol dehydrogenase family)